MCDFSGAALSPCQVFTQRHGMETSLFLSHLVHCGLALQLVGVIAGD